MSNRAIQECSPAKFFSGYIALCTCDGDVGEQQSSRGGYYVSESTGTRKSKLNVVSLQNFEPQFAKFVTLLAPSEIVVGMPPHDISFHHVERKACIDGKHVDQSNDIWKYFLTKLDGVVRNMKRYPLMAHL